MLPSPKSYSILPTVYLAGKGSTVTIVPNERAFLFFEGEEYNVTVIGVNDDVPERTVPAHHVKFTVTARNGILSFGYTFAEEQEYTVIVSQNDKTICKLSVYALCDDL